MIKIIPVLGMSILIAVTTGCQSPPDVQPFADATGSLHLVVRQVGSDLKEEIANAHDDSAASRQIAEELATRFETSWGYREEALKAVASYADSMADVVKAANNSRATAQAVFDSGKMLFESVKGAFPGSDAAVNATREAVIAIYERFAKQRAATTVAESVRANSSYVRELAEVLAADLRRYRGELRQMRLNAQTQLKGKLKTEGDRPLAVLQDLKDKRAELLQKVNGATAEDERKKAFEQFTIIDKTIESETASDWYVGYVAQLDSMHRNFAALEATLQNAEVVTVAWAEAHRDLEAAVEKGMQPNYRLLTQLTVELLQTYSNYRKAVGND